MLLNFRKNRFWFYTGIEMLSLVFYFMLANQYFEFPPPSRETLSVLDDPIPLVIIATMAIYVIAWSLFNFGKYGQQIAVGFCMATMTVYFLGFLVRDCDLHQLSMATVLFGVIVVRIIHESITPK